MQWNRIWRCDRQPRGIPRICRHRWEGRARTCERGEEGRKFDEFEAAKDAAISTLGAPPEPCCDLWDRVEKRSVYSLIYCHWMRVTRTRQHIFFHVTKPKKCNKLVIFSLFTSILLLRPTFLKHHSRSSYKVFFENSSFIRILLIKYPSNFQAVNFNGTISDRCFLRDQFFNRTKKKLNTRLALSHFPLFVGQTSTCKRTPFKSEGWYISPSSCPPSNTDLQRAWLEQRACQTISKCCIETKQIQRGLEKWCVWTMYRETPLTNTVDHRWTWSRSVSSQEPAPLAKWAALRLRLPPLIKNERIILRLHVNLRLIKVMKKLFISLHGSSKSQL